MNSFSAKDSQRLKGIAIIFMMVFHCLSSQKRLGGHPVDFSPLEPDTAIKYLKYLKICVTIFAFITGYGLYLSWRNRKEGCSMRLWIAQRYVKTFSGFVFVYVLCAVGLALISGKPQRVYFSQAGPLGFVYLVADALGLAFLFGTPSIMHGWWYMSAVAVYILLVPIVCEIDRRVGMLPVILTTVALPRVLGLGFPGSSEIYTFIPAILMGMCFAKHHVFDRLSKVRLSSNARFDAVMQFVLYAGLLVASVQLFVMLDKKVVWEYHFALSAIGCILFCWKYLLPAPYVSTALEFLGKHSMNIYYVHSFIRKRFMGVIYASGSPLIIPLTLLAAALCVSIVIELLKKPLRFAQIRDGLIQRLEA